MKKHILEELAHGKPIQLVLDPPAPQIEAIDPENGEKILVNDPDWVKPELPDWNLVIQWLKEDEAFRGEWETARKYGAAYNADQLIILKEKLLKDPRNASAYKVAMEMVKTAAMWGDPKYSERTIQDVNNHAPQDAEAVMARIKQLREELGIDKPVVDVQAVEVMPQRKERTPAQIAHVQKMQAARAAAIAKRKAGKHGE